ncbi:nuclear transport factor 2 family protein [Larkinella insperata]|uniref:Nuclear transport factor 2 family protein n=1 Tax=Larkinella insperata TaxID=332158 RepID=A0ABW3QAX7_9BACT|nr:nuclear transport factor 2 family protein [Larkinella insperata]
MKTITLALLLAFNSLAGQQKPEPMEKQTVQIVTEFLTAVQTGDSATVAASLHPNIEWSQPGNNRFSGTKKSSAEVFQMVGGMLEVSAGTLALTDVNVTAVNGNAVACLVRWKAVKPTGVVLDVNNIDVYTVESGQITRAVVFSDNLAQEDEFWLR